MSECPENAAIWGLQDYAVFVPMTDKFYKTLKFTKITIDQPLEQFILDKYFGFDIRNSLYPRRFGHHEVFDDLREKFVDSDLDNLDLVFIHESISNAPESMRQLIAS